MCVASWGDSRLLIGPKRGHNLRMQYRRYSVDCTADVHPRLAGTHQQSFMSFPAGPRHQIKQPKDLVTGHCKDAGVRTFADLAVASTICWQTYTVDSHEADAAFDAM